MENTKKIKRIGIDARFYGPLGKGLGRYTQEIVDNIVKIDKDNKYVIFLTKDNFDEFIPNNKNVKKVLADVRWYTLKEQLVMPFLIAKEKLDLIHFPHFNVPIFCLTKFVVTIHDLILVKYPTQKASTLSPFLYTIKNIGYKITIWLAVRRAKKIIAVSEFTKNDIIEYFKIKTEKIKVIYEGVTNLGSGSDNLFTAKLDDKEVISEYNIDNPFLLYVGSAYPHKNLERLLSVFRKLHKKQPNLKLILGGKEDYFYKRLKEKAEKMGLSSKNIDNNNKYPVIFAGYIPDNKLAILYHKAACYVFPSLYEGFGLPPLDAINKGCLPVCSNKTSLPEILGDASLYFDPENEEDMQKQIEQALNNKELKEKLIKEGKNVIAKYDWWENARLTLKVYQDLL